MNIIESAPSPESVLDFIDESVRALQDIDVEPRFILLGPESYASFCEAVSKRFGRSPGTFEQYQYLTVVVDPFRGNTVCVTPSPRDLVDGVRFERV